MDRETWLTERFEENRARLRGVAYRLLGSLSEAEDAVQEARLRLRFATYVQVVQLALIDGSVGVIVAPFGRLSRVLTFTFAGDMVTRVDVIGDAARLRELEIVAI